MSSIKPMLIIACCLLTACSDGPVQAYPVAAQGLLSGAVSADGSHALIGSIHHGGSYWNVEKNERLFNWNHKAEGMSSLRAVALSGDGNRAVTCEEDTIVLWNTQTGKAEQFWKTEDRIHSISLNEKGSRALMGLRNGTVRYFDLEGGVAIYNFEHQSEVRSAALTPDGRFGISAGDDMIAKVYDLSTGQIIREKTLSNQIKIVAISDSGRLAFASAQRDASYVWDIQTDTVVFSKHNRVTNFTAVDFTDDEQLLSLGTFSGKILRLDAQTGQELKTWQAEPRKIYGSATSKAVLSLTDDGTNIVALTSDGMLEIF